MSLPNNSHVSLSIAHNILYCFSSEGYGSLTYLNLRYSASLSSRCSFDVITTIRFLGLALTSPNIGSLSLPFSRKSSSRMSISGVALSSSSSMRSDLPVKEFIAALYSTPSLIMSCALTCIEPLEAIASTIFGTW